MISNEILNHMDVEELRNYAFKQNEIIDAYGRVVRNQEAINSSWNELYQVVTDKIDAMASLNSKKGKMAEFANAMMDKYKEYLDRPLCEL